MHFTDLNAYLQASNEYEAKTLIVIDGEPFMQENGVRVPYKDWLKNNPRPYYSPLPRVSANGYVNYSGVKTVNHR